MSSSLFSQQFVHCGICHRQWNGQEPLHLTSCAHVLCLEHLNQKACPICMTRDILAIKLEEKREIPDEIRSLFQPIPDILESLCNASHFQIAGLTSQCQYYMENCLKLRDKCARQRGLLLQAKHELDSVAQLKSRIQDLEAVLEQGQRAATPSGGIISPSTVRSSSVFSYDQTQDTVDLTVEESSGDKNEKIFVQRLKMTAALKSKLSLQRLASSNSFHNSSCIVGSTQLIGSISTPERNQVKCILPSSEESSPGLDRLIMRSNNRFTNHVSRRNQSQFSSTTERLRITKRNLTYDNLCGSPKQATGFQGLLAHTRIGSSSNRILTQTGLLMGKDTKIQSHKPDSKANANKFRRIR